jgi:hypothetical protein
VSTVLEFDDPAALAARTQAEAAIPASHHMRILVHSEQTAQSIWPQAKGYGDIKLSWSPLDPQQTQAMKEAFDKAIAKGFRAFRLDRKGNQTGSPITVFDPKAENLLLIPQVVGG